tara:strand:+ start:2447 stop:3733 length:1287 start_codon:yes stop_codon:yes gene_type:complete
MLDIKFFREKPELIKKSEKRRGNDLGAVEDVIKFDKKWRESTLQLSKLKNRRNVVSEEINKLKKAGKSTTAKIKMMKKVVADINYKEKMGKEHFQKRELARKEVGNLIHKSVPKGKDESDNKVLKLVGKKPKFSFKPRDHVEIGKICDLFEFETASKVAGARFFYLKNEAALLDLALQKYAVDFLVKKGFSMHWVPMMMNRAALACGVNVCEFEDTIYKIEDEDLHLIGTSEHPLIALRRNTTLQEKDLPVKIGGISSCFRKEAGTHGEDDKGVYRVHQFNKIEQVVYCKPSDSERYFKELQANAESLFKSLKIPFRIVNMCTGDLGNKQSLQYDIEAWMPGQADGKGRYREVASCSNCLSYQSEATNTKFINKKGEKEYVHMLNSTGIATPRAIIPILENFQQKDGSVKIPRALWKYTGFKKIKAKK